MTMPRFWTSEDGKWRAMWILIRRKTCSELPTGDTAMNREKDGEGGNGQEDDDHSSVQTGSVTSGRERAWKFRSIF